MTPIQPNALPKDTPDIAPRLQDPNSFIPTPRRPRTPRVSTNLVFRPAVGARPASNRPRVTADEHAQQVGRAAEQDPENGLSRGNN